MEKITPSNSVAVSELADLRSEVETILKRFYEKTGIVPSGINITTEETVFQDGKEFIDIIVDVDFKVRRS
jgi:hypothetical protein